LIEDEIASCSAFGQIASVSGWELGFGETGGRTLLKRVARYCDRDGASSEENAPRLSNRVFLPLPVTVRDGIARL